MTSGAGGPRLPLSLASPERGYRVAFWLALAVLFGVGAAWPGAALWPLPILRAVYPGVRVLLAVVALLALVTGRLSWRAWVIADSEGVLDVGPLRRRRLAWPAISGFDVDRPGGLWGGYCVRALREDGGHVDLLGLRAYVRVPSVRHFDELHRLAWLLDGVRAAQDAQSDD